MTRRAWLVALFLIPGLMAGCKKSMTQMFEERSQRNYDDQQHSAAQSPLTQTAQSTIDQQNRQIHATEQQANTVDNPQ